MNAFRALLRHVLIWWLPLPIALVVLLCAFALWLTGTQPGTRMLLNVVAQQFDGQADDIQGTILSGLQVGRLQLAFPGTAVDLTDLRLDVGWSELGYRRLHVQELSAGKVKVDLTSTPEESEPLTPDEPFVMPELPGKVTVDRFAVGALDVTLEGEPIPVSVSNLAASLGVDEAGARLTIDRVHVAHEQVLADLSGQLNVRELADPWPLRATLNVMAQGLGKDSPLCASRMLAAQRSSKAVAPTKSKNGALAKSKKATSKKVESKNGAPTESPRKAADNAETMPTEKCAATVQMQAEGSLEQLKVSLDGATADGALTLLAQTGLAFDQPFPLRTANVNMRLSDQSGLTVTLDRQPIAQQPGIDRLVATLDADRLDLGNLVGDVIPPALLTARMAVDAQVADVVDVRHASIQATIAKGSRWNKHALAGTLSGRIDALPAPAASTPTPTSEPAAPTVTPSAPSSSTASATRADDPLAGFQLRDLLLDVTLGPNRVRAQGELSQGEGALTLDANTPRLDAFWPDLPGGASLKGKLDGRLAQHRGQLTARYTPGNARADTLGRAPMQAELVFSGGWGPGGERRLPPADRANQAGQSAVAAAPGTSPTAPAASAAQIGWRGKIERLSAGSMNFAVALQPVALSFLPQAAAPLWQWEVGATQLTATLPDKQRAVIAHQGSRGGPGRWQTAGRADNLVITRSMLRQIMHALDPEAVRERRQRVNTSPSDGQRRIALDASWDLQFAGALSGTARVARRDGDLRIPGDPPIPLGLTDLVVDVKATPTGGGASRLAATLDVRTKKMGTITGAANAVLVAGADGSLALDERRPMSVNLDADITDLTWVDLFVGDTMEVRGKVQAKVEATGTLKGQWKTTGTIRGQALRVVRIDEGVRLIDGTLEAHLDGTRLVLDKLRFPASLRVMPDEWRTREWITSNPDAKDGYAEATGQWDLQTAQGQIHLKLHRFPALQRSDRYAMVSGTVDVDAQLPRLSITGDLTADAGWFSLEILQGVPSLDEDVRVIKAGDAEEKKSSPIQMSMSLKFDMGPRFYITGMGLDAGLLGSIQIHMGDGRLTGVGALRTRGGGIEAYGQKLRLRRGTLTFQGRLDNPLLDIEALRTGDQVEAGVKVGGTAQRPRIDLVSYPDVSDVEKLSWLVLGRGPDENGNDAALLLSVGAALLGGGQPFYKQFGLDDVSIRSGAIGSSGSLLPDRTVASQVNLDSNSELATQFLVASKHFANGITLSVEQAMSGSETVGRASYELSRRWSLDLKGGAVNGLALVYRTFFMD
ncbi:translocation/assembly module TamB domain-containing protein [Bordetella tumulicola]